MSAGGISPSASAGSTCGPTRTRPLASVRAGSRFIVPTNSATNGVAGRSYSVAGRSALLESSGAHDADAVGHRQRFFLVVRHEHRRDAELELDAPDLVAQLLAHLRVERRQRLVQQQHARPHRERAGERNALLLAAGQLVRVLLRVLAEPDQVEQLRRRASRRSRPDCPRMRSPNATLSVADIVGNRL